MLWMWPGPRALTDVLVSAVLLLALWLWRATLRAAAVVLLLVGVVYLGYYLAVQSVPDEYFWFSVLSATWQEAHEYAESYRLADVLRLQERAKPQFQGGMRGFYAAAAELTGVRSDDKSLVWIRSMSWPQGGRSGQGTGPLQDFLAEVAA